VNDRNVAPRLFPWGAVAILTALNILSYADRQLLSLLAVPIQKSLGIDDVGLGLLQGLAFSIVFTLSSIPVGWAVDHFNRARIIHAGVTIWSAATMACGLSSSFWQLFTARIGVGAGEAALAPSAYAILSETTPKGRLASAMGIYAIGASIGIAFSLAAGGLIVAALATADLDFPIIGRIEPWQAVFLMLGAPGVLLAFTAYLLPRGSIIPPQPIKATDADGGSLLAFLKQHKRAFFAQQIGFAMLGLSGYAIAGWAPAHLQRNFDWSPALIGPTLGIAIGLSGMVGTLVVGWLADRAFGRGRRDAYFTTAIVTTAIGVPLIISAFLATDGWTCVILLGAGYLFLCSFGGICSAALQLMSPGHLRGRTSALYVFTLNMLGLGLGPLIVGALTEHVFGDRMLVGYSVAVTVAVAGSISIACLLGGRRAYRDTISAVEAG
jgi:MFS family permease